MFTTFIKTTLRSLWRNKGNSFLNIFGLAVGITCAGLIFLWTEDELGFDKMHVKRDRVYRVLVNQQYDANVLTHASTPGPMAQAMQAEIPGIAATCRTSEGLTSQLFTTGDKPVFSFGFYAEPTLFYLFTLPFVQGDASRAFSQLHSLVITERAAEKFFGTTQNAVGKTVRVDNKQDYVVSGVVKDPPGNSSLQFEWVAPFEVFLKDRPWLQSWANLGLTTYVELAPGADAAAISGQLSEYIRRREPTSIARPFLFGMEHWRLRDKFENGKQTGGRIEFVRLFTIIAWIILLIACINFMNLATARSEKRAKEVGVRKVLGAGKLLLVAQFIGEAVFMAALAAVAALLFMWLLLPEFNMLVQKQLTLDPGSPAHLTSLALVILICGLVAGSYPALYLSSFNPVGVLKGFKLKTGGAAFIRKGLVVLQFSVSIILIICTVVIFQQIQHVKNRQLGFKKENLIEMNVQGNLAQRFATVRQELINTGYVENVAMSDYATLYAGNNTGNITWPGKPPGAEVLISMRAVSPEFTATYGMQLAQGRAFNATDKVELVDGNPKTPHLNVIITESLARLLGNGPAVGKTLRMPGSAPGGDMQMHIVGVVKDFIYGNMYGKPDPVIFMWLPPQLASVLYVRTKANFKPDQALAQIEAVMKRNNPGYPFDYRFVDDQFNQLFTNETLIGKLAKVFAVLAILISCLGLFGLAAYTAERRTKEVGIRKVLGASVTGLARLLSKDFLQLVIVACVVAFPVAWWAMNNWLHDFEYRVSIYWWVFAAAGLLAILIALVTVSFQAIKAALANPVKSLRTE